MRSKFRILVLILFLIGGCGGEEGPEGSPSRLALRLHLPGALSKTEARRQAFEARVIRLELTLTSKAGLKQVLTYPPSEWDRISLAEFAFPQFPEDRLVIQAKVWDLDRDGTQRPHPVLTGKAEIKATELATQGPTVVPIRLALKVPVAEYD